VSPWYEDSFGRDYMALYPHRDLAEARADVAGIVGLVNPPKGQPLLDLCCGAGRHLQALHETGFTDLTGIDLSQQLLDIARRRLDAVGAGTVRLIRSDMRKIPHHERFATVLSLFTSFGYFADASDDETVLRAVHAALRPGGTFSIDTLNRSWTIARLEPRSDRAIDGARVAIERTISADGLRVEKEIRIETPGTPPKSYRESVRMYTAGEMKTMLERAGFADLRFYGGLDGRAHDVASPRMIVVATRPQEIPA